MGNMSAPESKPNNNLDYIFKTVSGSTAFKHISFKTSVDFNYPVNLVDSFSTGSQSIVYTTKILNFAGFMGVLPLSFRHDVFRKHRSKNDSLGDFLDIFNSRNLLFLAQLSSRSSSELLSTRKKHSKNKHEFSLSNSMLAIAGFLAFDAKPESKIGWKFYAFFSGFFSSRLRNHSNLEQILEYLVKMPVKIIMFSKRSVLVNENIQGNLCNLKNNSSGLGVNMVLGKRMVVYQRNATIKLGPLAEHEFESMLPKGKLLKLLTECVKVFWNDTVFVDVRMIRSGETIGPCFLGKVGFEKKLGLNSWLSNNHSRIDRSDCNFSLLAPGSGH